MESTNIEVKRKATVTDKKQSRRQEVAGEKAVFWKPGEGNILRRT